MYTRCPSCRAEISFEPPANMETLPDGYKHRIKCPSCGVTIGVKINKIDTQAATLVQQAPAYTQPQTNFEPVYNSEGTAAVPAKKAKHSGVGRNVVMMLMSLLFVALTVVGYFVNTGKIKNDLFGIAAFDGISGWITLIKDTSFFKALFDHSVLYGILYVLPMALLVFAGINFLVAFISACGKKYGRAYNVLSSIIIGLVAIAVLFAQVVLNNEEGLGFGAYYKSFVTKEYVVLAGAVLGLLQIIFGLCFTKSLERKEKKAK